MLRARVVARRASSGVERTRALEGMVVQVVCGERFSGSNSLKSGNLLGKYINFRLSMTLAAPD
jgi:hypothetical protein